MPLLTNGKPAELDSRQQPDDDQAIRRLAIQQIDRRRRFWTTAVVTGFGLILLVVVWALSEYHNAGGWPMHGFSQSSGMHDVWNLWIIYPMIGWLVLLAVGGWSLYVRKPISEDEISREIERQTRQSR